MSITQADIDALKRAIITGTVKVDYKDRSVTYRSIAEMKEALAFAEAEFSGKQPKRSVNPIYDSGL